MADALPSYESVDLNGSTDHFNGTVGVVAIDVPSVAGGVISEMIIQSRTKNQILSISFDGGANYWTIGPGGAAVAWTPKGNKTQIKLIADTATTKYEIIMNREPT